MKNNYTIYSLESYQIYKSDYEKHSFEGTIEEITEKLKTNNSWHIQINPTKKCIMFGDFDHTTKERFNEFLMVLCDVFKEYDLTKDKISYTQSKNLKGYSFHWSIPSIIANVKLLKRIFQTQQFINFIESNELDLSVYPNNFKFLRLPNQTNKEKVNKHKIKQGKIQDFIIEYIDNSEYYDITNDEVDEEEDETTEEEKVEEKELDIELVEKLLNNLSADLDYNDWVSVGMALKNDGYDFEIWNNWSKTGSKYNKNIMSNKWHSFQKGGEMSIKKIKSLVKSYNIEGYNEIFKTDEQPDFIDHPSEKKTKNNNLFSESFLKSLSGLEADIANYIVETYLKDQYVCVSCDEKTFYYYKKNRWVEDLSNINIFNFLRNNYVDELTKYKTSIEDKDDIKKINKLLGKINGKISGINGIIDWLAKLLYNPKFYDLCDNNIYLLGFDNGVYDTRTKEFREGRPTDYITKSVGYDFPTEDKGYLKDIKQFLKEVFPDKDLRNYVLQQQAQALSGKKSEDCVYNHTGRGGNGKSIEQQILKVVFGDYFLEIPSTMLTKVNKMEHNKPDPFYSELKGVRYSIANEPSDGSKINDSLIKIMGSKEGIKYRTLFSNKVEKLLIQTQLHIYCNNKLDFNANDGGLCRRLKVIDYVSKFSGDKKLINKDNNIYEMDVELSEKVLLWREDYMKMLLNLYNPNYKYSEPSSVIESSTKYCDSNNDIKKFILEYFEFTNNKEDYLLMKDIKLLYQSNKEFDQTKIKNLKELLEKEMNTNILEKTKVKKGERFVDVRSVIKGWRLKIDEDSDNEDNSNL
jgi:P4 family phage/plasmid primase-like protien